MPLYSVFRPGTYESGDLTIHATKLIEFYQNLSQGIIPPQWSENLNAHFGYPLFLFTYQTPYYWAAVFRVLGTGYLLSMKLAMASAFLISGLAMYLWAKKEFKSGLAGCAAGIFYWFTPYHLIDLHFRTAAGEVMAFMVVPLVLLSIQKKSVVLTAITMWLLVLSHQVISLAVLPILVYYCFLKYKQGLVGLVLGCLLAAHYWLPILVEGKFLIEAIHPDPMVYPKVWELVFSPWRYGLLFQGHQGELSPVIGYTQLLVVGLVIYKKMAKVWLGLFLGYLFMITPWSAEIWRVTPLLKNFQFSSRLLAIETVLISILAAAVITKIPKKIAYLLLGVTILYPILNWGNRRNIPEISDPQLIKNLPYLTYQTEGYVASTKWFYNGGNPWEGKVWNVPLEGAQVTQGLRTAEIHDYGVEASRSGTLIENTWYFPGWVAYVDGRKTPVVNDEGLIGFAVPEGKHDVSIRFENTADRNLGVAITVAMLGVLALLSVKSRYAAFSSRARTTG